VVQQSAGPAMVVRLGGRQEVDEGGVAVHDREDLGRENLGRTQCCSLRDFHVPVVAQVEPLVAFARQKLLGSPFDQARVGEPFGIGEEPGDRGVKKVLPPLRELLWGEGRRWWGACGA
jgi:hypothetical protein